MCPDIYALMLVYTILLHLHINFKHEKEEYRSLWDKSNPIKLTWWGISAIRQKVLIYHETLAPPTGYSLLQQLAIFRDVFLCRALDLCFVLRGSKSHVTSCRTGVGNEPKQVVMLLIHHPQRCALRLSHRLETHQLRFHSLCLNAFDRRHPFSKLYRVFSV